MSVSLWLLFGGGSLLFGGVVLWSGRRWRQRQRWQSHFAKAQQAYDAGDIRGASALFEELLVLAPALQPDVARRAALYNRLARCYEAAQRYPQAIEMCQQEIALVRSHWGNQDPRLTTAMHDMALLYHQHGQLDEAIAACREMVTQGRQSLGERHPEVALGEKNLAELLLSQGITDEAADEAEALMLHGMESLRRVFGPEDEDVIAIRRALIELYRERGNVERQQVYMQQDLAFFRKTLGETDPETIVHMLAMASFFCERGDWHAASLLYQEYREHLDGISPTPVKELCPILAQEAECYRQMSQHVQAIALFERALGMASPDEPLRYSWHTNLGAALAASGDVASAKATYEKALALAETTGDNPAAALHNLASLAASSGQPRANDDAIQLFRRALQANEQHLGTSHPDVARVLGQLIPLLEGQGAKQEVQELKQRLQAISTAAKRPTLVPGAIPAKQGSAASLEES